MRDTVACYAGGDLARLSDPAVRDSLKPCGAAVFHGECEWYPGQLEEELLSGCWQVGQVHRGSVDEGSRPEAGLRRVSIRFALTAESCSNILEGKRCHKRTNMAASAFSSAVH